MINARIVEDSIATNGKRLTTFVLTYPRFIHSELMTHRAFSRNAASSRAIPFRRMVEMIQENIAMPIKWGAAQKGMQSGDEIENAYQAIEIWRRASIDAVFHAQSLDSLGVHKSISNRLLEPFAHMTTIVSATEWYNFYSLRAHKDAQPEFQELAYLMLDAYLNMSEPEERRPNPQNPYNWHLPFVDRSKMSGLSVQTMCAVSVARCARVSYLNFKDSTFDEDFKLHEKLAESGHWSPFEHCAYPAESSHICNGNFLGWWQYRKEFDGENRTQGSLQRILDQRQPALGNGDSPKLLRG